jgi:phosphoserine aminotransferase
VTRVFNFGAGPAVLPVEVLEQARDELLDWRGRGLSVMEMSHRSPEYEAIHGEALAALRRLLAIPAGFAVLLLPGGASLQFAMVPMNLLPAGGSADYLVTGVWAQKALADARRVGAARVAGSTESETFARLPRPDEIDLDPAAAYVHVTSNNTIAGTQWRALPDAGAVPLAIDASSDVLARAVPWERVGVLYAGAQKNLGPAGVTLVVVREDLAARAPGGLPAMLDYRRHAEAGSLYNTPPCWAIYVLGLCCRWVEAKGGVAAMERAADERAAILYDLIDGSGFYRGTADPASRSRMNVTFRLPSEELERRFLAAAEAAGLIQLKGHRLVGGLRASLYNAMPRAGVEALAALMRDFERRNG